MRICLAAFGTIACLFFSGCRSAADHIQPPAIVGAWLVNIPQAPFPYHMFVFHPDGTMLQSNPDAGDANTSDSNGIGAWSPDDGGIRGKFVEVTADRSTRRFVSRGEISFSVRVDSDAFTGTATARFYDEDGRQLRAPVMATMKGRRIKP